MMDEAQKVGALVVTGYTKVVPKSGVDGLFINTSSMGEVVYDGIFCRNVRPGDIDMDMELQSDCNSLCSLMECIINTGATIHAMRDPTRGGLSAVLSFLIYQERMPIKKPVVGLGDLLSFEPFYLACEGKLLFLAIPPKNGQKVLKAIGNHPDSKDAAIIGEALPSDGIPKVFFKTPYGTHRILEPPMGERLPRSC